MRVVLALAVAIFAAPSLTEARTVDRQIPAARCGRLVCGAPIDVVCHAQGGRTATVVVPWSRADLPSSVLAGTLTRLTFSSGQYRSSLYGSPRLRTRHGRSEAVFDIGPWFDGALFALLQTSSDVRVSGDYGSYRVERRKGQADPCAI